MNSDMTEEAIFIDTFVVKDKRERVLFELKSKKNRRNFFSNLCHRYHEIFDPQYMVKIPPSNSSSKDIFEMLIKEGAGKQGYLLSYHDELDGQRMSLSEALDNCVGRGMPSIVICIPDELAYFEAEQEVDPPPRFILSK